MMLFGRTAAYMWLWGGSVVIWRKKKKRKNLQLLINSIPNFPFQEGGALPLGAGTCWGVFCSLLPWSNLRLIPDLAAWALQRLSRFLTKWRVSRHKLLSTWAHRQTLNSYLGGWREGDQQAIWLTASCSSGTATPGHCWQSGWGGKAQNLFISLINLCWPDLCPGYLPGKSGFSTWKRNFRTNRRCTKTLWEAAVQWAEF